MVIPCARTPFLDKNRQREIIHDGLSVSQKANKINERLMALQSASAWSSCHQSLRLCTSCYQILRTFRTTAAMIAISKKSAARASLFILLSISEYGFAAPSCVKAAGLNQNGINL